MPSFSARPQHTALGRARQIVFRLLEIVAGMSGVFTSRLTPLRVCVTASIIAASTALSVSGYRPSHALALGTFVSLFSLRHMLLFLSFTRGGVADRLKARFGPERAFAIYEAVTAWFFAARSLSFVWLLEATPIAVGAPAAHALYAAGLVLATIGMIVNVWAASVVGLGTYYYADLFLGDQAVDFKVEGPYRYWKNPMYGIGQLGSCGAALMALSPLGLVAGLLNQLLMYLFNWLVEQPHSRRARG